MSPPKKIFCFREGDLVLKEDSEFIYIIRKCYVTKAGYKKYFIKIKKKLTTVYETQLVKYQCNCELFPFNSKVSNCKYRGLF
jgi:hypothetical protein